MDRRPGADARFHVRVVGPEPVEAAIGRIHAGQAPLDGELGQAGIGRLPIRLHAFRAIAFEDGAIEVPEDEERGRWAGVCGRSAAQEFGASLKDVVDESKF